jgi:cysteine desulfurase/selenocysteine lyase
MPRGIPSTIREDFPALERKRKGKPPIYFDNACTTLVPNHVIDAVAEYYEMYPGCGGGRSRYWFAEEVSNRIEGSPASGTRGSRKIVQEFINAESGREIIFTQNASHAINMVALGYRFRPGDTVLLTDKEHNSNLIPWLRLHERGIVSVDYVKSREDETFDFGDLERKLGKGRVTLVSMAYTSNLTGYTIPAKDIIKVAHDHGARVLLDAAQTVPHQSVDVQDLDVDFLAFSVHKMCGPRGVGVLYGKRELLGQQRRGGSYVLEPVMLGGGTVSDTTYDGYDLLDPPGSFEVGIQDYAGQIAAGAAVEYLQRIGLGRIGSHVARLNAFLTEQLRGYCDQGWLRILGPHDASKRGGILTFELRRPNAVGLVEEFDRRCNLMIRDGAFCANSYLNGLYGRGWNRPNVPSEHRMFYRVSLYFYNTLEECRTFVNTLHKIFEERGYLSEPVTLGRRVIPGGQGSNQVLPQAS